MNEQERQDEMKVLGCDEQQAKELAAALEAMTPRSWPAVSADFNAILRRRFQQERIRWARWMMPLRRVSAVAAALLIGILLGGILVIWRQSAASVAWGDVLKAMNQVSQFHATMFVQRENGQERLDYFYREPNTWRGQGLEMVQFHVAGQSKLFDIKTRAFVDPQQTKVAPLPASLDINRITEGDLLTGILWLFFQNKVPVGEPVKSAAEARAGDMEVFDYAHGPTQIRARIWVLKTSRLPIRIEMHSPTSGDLVLVLFDYSDPQSDAFFDPQAFARQVEQKHLTKAQEIYRVGREENAGGGSLSK
jgi:hypothetical protein